MGCLNSEGQFEHWFGNIHLSGPCNRSCYFCIGQHMMALDPLNNLDEYPLENLDKFVQACKERGVTEINVTGSNTDPLLYKHTHKLKKYLEEHLGEIRFGIRTNGVLALRNSEILELYDKGSISITTFDPDLYKKTMGSGKPPNVEKIFSEFSDMDWKGNVILCHQVTDEDLANTLDTFSDLGVKRVNLREPYGQPHIGDPLSKDFFNDTPEIKKTLGMPTYQWGNTEVTYWDVHYVEVESVNLYANGEVSMTYPVTEGHDPVDGKVESQDNFQEAGRIREQWQY